MCAQNLTRSLSHCHSPLTSSDPINHIASWPFPTVGIESLLSLQVAAQTDRHNALAKLGELEGVLQQALDQRAQASEEASRVHSQLTKKTGELTAAQQQLQQQHQELTVLQVCS